MVDMGTPVVGPALRSPAADAPAARAEIPPVARRRLFERLDGAARVTLVSAPAGSGKTVLLRSWAGEAGLAGRAAWVQGDPQQFWVSVADALRATPAGAGLVRPLTGTPGLDGWDLAERLVDDLGPLADRIWLIIDDLHELGSGTTLAQLRLLVHRAPPQLRFVLAARHDPRLGLHRLRLEGELTEIQSGDLAFTPAEARVLLHAAGAQLPDRELERLVERTGGWAAGLRLAALSLAGDPDPGRYMLAEVLDRQDEKVRRLLLRTSVLERINGQLADLLTGEPGSERVLRDLAAAGAFVVAVDAGRSWFRYPPLLADLLRVELRRSEPPPAITGLHSAAAGWFAEHGFAVEAIRHAQAAQDWALAARLLVYHGPGLHLGGQDATVHALLAGFPAEARAADAELAALAATDELTQGSPEAAERYLELAARGMASVPADRRGKLRVLLRVVRLLLARQRDNLAAVAEEAQQLRAVADAPGTARLGLGEDLRALALVNLGITEAWTGRLGQGQRHLEQGIALARRIGLPFLEFTGLAYQAPLESFWSVARASERSMQAIELARGHGWTGDPAASIAYLTRADALVWQGRLDEAEPWVRQAERTVRPEAEPAAGLALYYVRGRLELVRGHDQEALAAFEATERLAAFLAAPHLLLPRARAELLHVLVRTGDTERAGRALAGLGDQERDRGEIRIATAALRLAQGYPHSAAAALAPVIDGSAPVSVPTWLVRALLLDAMTRDALGDAAAAGRALERALDLAEPDRTLSAFVLQPAPGLLRRHARNCTRHANLIAEIVRLLPGGDAEPGSRRQPPAETAPRAAEEVSDSESRVLRYLPTNLSAPEIAGELSLSVNTVRTHMRHLFVKLDVHSRTDAVVRARALGLLPSPHPS